MPRLALAREALSELTEDDLAEIVGARNSLLCVLTTTRTDSFRAC